MHKSMSSQAQWNGSSLKIKGRLIPYEEFSARLKNFYVSLGFGKVKIRHVGSGGEPDGIAADILQKSSGVDAVIVLSCRVAYNPDWGGYCGLPQLLVREKNGDGAGQCPAAFISPFLQQYRFAKEHIYLTATGQGNHLITLPESLLQKDEDKPGSTLIVKLDKIAEPDKDGAIVPVMVSGSMFSYALSDNLRRNLDALNFDWKPGRSIPIGEHLGSELFSFADAPAAVDRNSPFGPTLLPYLHRIVTHRTPNLRAAEIHLRQEFSRTIATFTADRRAGFGNMLCLAGLDIDMSAFKRREEHYFVPWKAWLDTMGEGCGEEHTLEQDELFARLVQRA